MKIKMPPSVMMNIAVMKRTLPVSPPIEPGSKEWSTPIQNKVKNPFPSSIPVTQSRKETIVISSRVAIARLTINAPVPLAIKLSKRYLSLLFINTSYRFDWIDATVYSCKK